jgi:glutamyl-tRNA reductase
MSIVLLGLNHQTAPVEIRERLACRDPGAETAAVKGLDAIREAVIISTCNRLEVLHVSDEPDTSVAAVTDLLSRLHAIGPGEFSSALYVHRELEAVRHLFRVAASLDSMVVGEPQILGQIKDAYRTAVGIKATGAILNRLLHKTFAVAKRVRTETGIGAAGVSVGHAAVELASKIFGDLGERRVLLIGAGEMAELTAEHLLGQGVAGLTIVNRSLDRAVELARRFRGQARAWEELPAALTEADVVICSTGAERPVVTVELVKGTLRGRRRRPLFLIDIAVPRDVAPGVGDLPNVFAYDIDDLTEVARTNLGRREAEAVRAEAIVAEEVLGFAAWLESLATVPTIAALTGKAEDIRLSELARTLKGLGALTPEQIESLDLMTQALVKKILHDPIRFLKEGGRHGHDREAHLALTRRIFNLNSESNSRDND